MRAPVLRTVLAALPLALFVGCSDSPAAPPPTLGDRLNAVADSTGAASDPLPSLIHAAAALVDLAGGPSAVTITVDGAPTPFQAVVLETSTSFPGSCVGTCVGAGPITSQLLFAWDGDRMHRFVLVESTSLPSPLAGAPPSGVATSFGLYAERTADGRAATTFGGVAQPVIARVSTGSTCATGRRGAAVTVDACTRTTSDYSLALDVYPVDLLSFSPPALGAAQPAHSFRMATSRVAGAAVTLHPVMSFARLPMPAAAH